MNYIYGNCVSCKNYINKTYDVCQSCESNLITFIDYSTCLFCNIKKPCICNVKYIITYQYNSTISKIILNMKYNDNMNLSIFFANKIAPKLLEIIDINNLDDYVFVGIPTTYKKLKSRGYNQSIEMCKQLGEICKIKYDLFVFMKNRTTEQKNKSKEERMLNSTSINLDKYDNIINKKIILVDDVIASGATLQRCINLLSSISNNIYVVAIAKS